MVRIAWGRELLALDWEANADLAYAGRYLCALAQPITAWVSSASATRAAQPPASPRPFTFL